MKTETHVVIGRAISRYLHLDPRLEKCFIRGLKKPDLKAKRRGRRVYRHHGIYPKSIMHIVWSARRAYLARDYEKALEILGVALHYLQDKCVIGARKSSRRIHNRVEREIASLEIPVDAIREGFDRAECSPLFVRTVLYSIKPSTNPAEALRNACLYSAMITGAVYNSSQPPRELLEILEKIKMEKMERKKKMKKIVWIPITLLIVGLALIPIQPLVSTTLLALSLIYLLLSLISIHTTNPQLHEQLAWYGLE